MFRQVRSRPETSPALYAPVCIAGVFRANVIHQQLLLRESLGATKAVKEGVSPGLRPPGSDPDFDVRFFVDFRLALVVLIFAAVFAFVLRHSIVFYLDEVVVFVEVKVENMRHQLFLLFELPVAGFAYVFYGSSRSKWMFPLHVAEEASEN